MTDAEEDQRGRYQLNEKWSAFASQLSVARSKFQKFWFGTVWPGFKATFWASLWVAVAFLAAYPSDVYNLHHSKIVDEFMNSLGHRVFIPVVILFDLVVDHFLGDSNIGKNYWLIILAALVYLLIPGLAPSLIEKPTHEALQNYFLVGLLALIFARSVPYVHLQLKQS